MENEALAVQVSREIATLRILGGSRRVGTPIRRAAGGMFRRAKHSAPLEQGLEKANQATEAVAQRRWY